MTNYTQWKSLVDLHEYSAIPDSGNLYSHYDVSDLDGLSEEDVISTLEDLSGNGRDLTGQATYREDDLNGLPTAELDGIDDGWDSELGGVNQPQSAYAVVNVDDMSNRQTVIGAEESIGGDIVNPIEARAEDDDWQMFWGSSIQGSSVSDGWQLTSAIADGSESRFRKDGSEEFTGDVGTSEWGAGSIGYRASENDRHLQGNIAEVLIYDVKHDDETAGEVESYLSDKWSLTI